MLAGAETFIDIAPFGQKNIAFLCRFLPFRDGTPSRDRGTPAPRARPGQSGRQVQRDHRHSRALDMLVIEGAIITTDVEILQSCVRQVASAV
jgi:hypothetical protein